MEWARVVDNIRIKPGFESFLQPLAFAELQTAAEHGPVIIVNISQQRSDALIVYRQGKPVLVPLPRATPTAVQALANRLSLRAARPRDEDVVGILQDTWDLIVSPVAEQLRRGRRNLSLGSRIWWCPSGLASRLPLHAAGPYNNVDQDLPDLFISSYTPTLSALVRAREAWNRNQTPEAAKLKPTVLMVGQPNTPDEDPLPGVTKELAAIQKYATSSTVMEGKRAARETVLEGLAAHAWVHLACHGHHNQYQPFLSHFSMYDGHISLRDLIQKDLPQAQFAFLSACHSAKVNELLPDEALHPAAGMLFVGYQSVVGTMWALDDEVGAVLADGFYRLMLGGKLGPKDCSKAAEALARTLKAMETRFSLSQRVNVVHFGV